MRQNFIEAQGVEIGAAYTRGVPPLSRRTLIAPRPKPAQDGIMPRATKPPDKSFRASVTIEATFGSDMQKSVAMRVLTDFLEVWKQNVENAHEDNEINITSQ